MNEVPAVSSLLRPLAKVMLPVIRKLRAERKAGENPFTVHPEHDPLDQQFDAVLARLGSIESHNAFWTKFLTRIGAAYTRPEFFEKPSVQEWLSHEQVKTDFKSLARARLIGASISSEALNRVQDAYSDATGEAKIQATYAITVVLAVLQESAQTSITPGEALNAGMTRDFATESREANERIEAKLDRLAPPEDPLYGEKLKGELRQILDRRGIPGINSAEEIEALIVRIENGELSRAPESEKAEAYYWAARIFCPDENKIAQTKKCLEVYRNSSFSKAENVTLVEGWLEFVAGDTKDAINTLLKIDTPDSRTGLLIFISKKDGKSASLAWLNDLAPYDHTLLSPVGWRHVAITMAEEGRWEDAVELLDALPDQALRSFPELLFVIGVMHASFLLPEPIRLRLLQDSNIDFQAEVQEGEVASKHRRKAIEALIRARESMLKVGAEKRARGCDYHLMWIRLTDAATRTAALKELKEGMKDGEYAAFMLDIALNIDDTFDREPLERYLRRRKREGCEIPLDHLARLRLHQHFGPPSDVILHLEEEARTLSEILTKETLTSIKIHALLNDDRVADAEKELESCTGSYSSEFVERHQFMIADRKGEELENLEALYQRTGDYEDLLNLVRYLERTHQWASLIPYACKLLETRRNPDGLLTVVRAMEQSGAPSSDIVGCFDANQDLVKRGTREGDILLLSRGWALFSLGRFKDAHEIVDDVVARNHESNAIALEMNLALRTGQWEHFPAIIDREYSKLQEFPSQLLLHMASVVADWDQDRAMIIAGIAAEKDPGEGSTQANAYWLASQIGREIDAAAWLDRVIRLAEKGEGPAQAVTLREMAEMMPARAEQRREWEQKFITGEIGIHPAASLLNLPIAHILIGEPLRNENEVDPRRRSIIPFRHGSRGLFDLKGISNVSFDLSSLLVLEHLEILDIVFDKLDSIRLSPRLMDALFSEHRQVRFHQPSLVMEARKIRELIADDVIQLLPTPHPPKEMVDEVGAEMAALLHSAQTTHGRVLSTLPVHKAGSLEQEGANLREYGPLILKTTQFLQIVEGQVSPEVSSRARTFLESVDRGEELGPAELGEGPIFVDDLALRHLNTAGVLQCISHLGRDIFVSESTNSDAKALIDAASHGDQVANIIDRLRKRIRDGVLAEKITFLPESVESEDQDRLLTVNSLQDVIANVGAVDAVCLDDRAVGKHINVTDREGRTVPLINSIDILNHLTVLGAISEEKRRTCDFRLRNGGFAFLPLYPDTLLSSLRDSIDKAQSQFRESRDLVAIRGNLQRIRSLKILRLPEEVAWISQMADTTRQLLTEVWNASDIELDMAQKISDWVLTVLSPLPTAWHESIVLAKEEDIKGPTKFALLQLINTGFTLTNMDRREAFAVWAQRRLIDPLLPANALVVDELSDFIWPRIAEITKRIADESC